MYNSLISLSNKEKSFLNVARALAFQSKERRMHGAVVVKGGRVLGSGWNKGTNHPTVVSQHHIKTHCSRHAEEEAIKNGGSNLKGATIYVARINRDGIDRNSKPCQKCERLIKEAGIKRVIYTTEKS